MGVSVDPPGPNAHRIIRITNVRANAAAKGLTQANATQPIISIISVFGSNAVTIVDPTHAVARVQLGMIATVSTSSPAHLREGYSNSWKTENIADTCANGAAKPFYFYAGGTSHPPEAAQSVPGAVYDTESGFQYQNDSINRPLDVPTNALACSAVSSVGYPFASAGFGGLNTGVTTAGVADQGTRLALRFTNVPPGASIQVPQVVQLFNIINNGITGVMVLTNADSAELDLIVPPPAS